MKNKKVMMCAGLILVLTLLSGCSLAAEAKQGASEEDHLCGVYITLGNEDKGKDFDEKHLYATPTGEGNNREYVFKGLKGFTYFESGAKD